LGCFSSGIAQPLCAVISDRLGTRILGIFGIALGAIGISLLGLAEGFVSLAVIYVLGMIGLGMFHPIGASTIGLLRHQSRTSAVSLFFVAGMIGGVLGAFAWPRLLASSVGFQFLPLAIFPALLLTWLVSRSVAQLPTLPVAISKSDSAAAPHADWKKVTVLFVASALRFCVNLSLMYLYMRWVQSSVAAANTDWSAEQVATTSAPLVGNLNASTLAGMALGGLLAGMLVRPGREKWPLVLVPILFAPVIVLFPHLPLSAGYLLAAMAGVGFASMIPVSIALAQHLMPSHPNLGSSLMMGGAWAVAMLGPRCAEFSATKYGIPTTFYLAAATLALAGIVCLPVAGAKAE